MGSDCGVRFEVTLNNDPRGAHWVVFDSTKKRAVCARDYSKANIGRLLVMFNDEVIQPDFESRAIGSDALLHLKATEISG